MRLDSHGTPAQVGRFTGVTQRVDYTATAARSTVLQPNTVYRIYFSTAAYWKPGISSVTAVATSDIPVPANWEGTHATDDLNLYISAVQASAGGSMWISEVELD